jgi:hypothetical protein
MVFGPSKRYSNPEIQIQRPAELVTRLNRFVDVVNRKEVRVPLSKLTELSDAYKLFSNEVNVTMKDGRLVLEIPGARLFTGRLRHLNTDSFCERMPPKSSFRRLPTAKPKRCLYITAMAA